MPFDSTTFRQPTVTAALIIAACVPPAHGQTQAWAGFGVASCAEYAQDYKLAPRELGGEYFTWAQGFMSGLNILHLGTKGTATDLLNSKAFPTQAQERFLQRYCDQHPLASFADAVLALWSEMRRTQGLPPSTMP